MPDCLPGSPGAALRAAGDVDLSDAMVVRHFTLEQANDTLPLVRRIVSDIVADYAQWKEKVDRYELIAAGSRSEWGETVQQLDARREVEDIARRIEAYLDELGQIGCVLKGFEDGLVDFHSKRDGRDVFLCWRLGEPAVEYWHEIDGGFAGRRAVG